jgi:hypothetical protein
MRSHSNSTALRHLLAAASAVAFFTLLAGQAAFAATENVSASGNLVPDLASNFSFPQFNPSLGTLNSITLSATETLGGGEFDEQYLNWLGTDTVASVTASQTINIVGASGTLLSLPQSLTQTVTYTTNGSHLFLDLPDASPAGPTTVTDAADLALFTGTGTFYLGSDGTGPVGVTAVSGITDIHNGSQMEFVTVDATYDYTPAGTVPEPGCLTLLAGAGLSGAGLMFRKRR